MPLDNAKIVAQRGKRDLSPVRTRVCAGKYRLTEQDAFYDSARTVSLVLTTRLLTYDSRFNRRHLDLANETAPEKRLA